MSIEHPFPYRTRTDKETFTTWCGSELDSEESVYAHLETCQQCQDYEKHVLRIYLSEIKTQCKYAIRDVQRFNDALQQQDPPEVFHAAHSFLTHVSNVSRLLWPVSLRSRTKGEQAYRRGLQLRLILSMPDEHTLKKRSLRNLLEHYDEKIDDWTRESTFHNYVDMCIGPRGTAIKGIDDRDIMRFFDNTSGEFIFRGKKYDLQALADAVQEIVAKVESCCT